MSSPPSSDGEGGKGEESSNVDDKLGHVNFATPANSDGDYESDGLTRGSFDARDGCSYHVASGHRHYRGPPRPSTASTPTRIVHGVALLGSSFSPSLLSKARGSSFSSSSYSSRSSSSYLGHKRRRLGRSSALQCPNLRDVTTTATTKKQRRRSEPIPTSSTLEPTIVVRMRDELSRGKGGGLDEPHEGWRCDMNDDKKSASKDWSVWSLSSSETPAVDPPPAPHNPSSCSISHSFPSVVNSPNLFYDTVENGAKNGFVGGGGGGHIVGLDSDLCSDGAGDGDANKDDNGALRKEEENENTYDINARCSRMKMKSKTRSKVEGERGAGGGVSNEAVGRLDIMSLPLNSFSLRESDGREGIVGGDVGALRGERRREKRSFHSSSLLACVAEEEEQEEQKQEQEKVHWRKGEIAVREIDVQGKSDVDRTDLEKDATLVPRAVDGGADENDSYLGEIGHFDLPSAETGKSANDEQQRRRAAEEDSTGNRGSCIDGFGAEIEADVKGLSGSKAEALSATMRSGRIEDESAVNWTALRSDLDNTNAICTSVRGVASALVGRDGGQALSALFSSEERSVKKVVIASGHDEGGSAVPLPTKEEKCGVGAVDTKPLFAASSDQKLTITSPSYGCTLKWKSLSPDDCGGERETWRGHHDRPTTPIACDSDGIVSERRPTSLSSSSSQSLKMRWFPTAVEDGVATILSSAEGDLDTARRLRASPPHVSEVPENFDQFFSQERMLGAATMTPFEIVAVTGDVDLMQLKELPKDGGMANEVSSQADFNDIDAAIDVPLTSKVDELASTRQPSEAHPLNDTECLNAVNRPDYLSEREASSDSRLRFGDIGGVTSTPATTTSEEAVAHNATQHGSDHKFIFVQGDVNGQVRLGANGRAHLFADQGGASCVDTTKMGISTSSSSSSFDDDDDSTNKTDACLSLEERRQRNVERLRQRWESISGGMHPQMNVVPSEEMTPVHERSMRSNKNTPSTRESMTTKTRRLMKRRGMLFTTPYNGTTQVRDRVDAAYCERSRGILSMDANDARPERTQQASIADEVVSRYPYREGQIRLLSCVLSSAVQRRSSCASFLSDVCTSDSFVPPPVFVTGQSGTGKTSVVRDVLSTLKRRSGIISVRRRNGKRSSVDGARIADAYVDCATVESTSIAEILDSAFQQLSRSFGTIDNLGVKKATGTEARSDIHSGFIGKSCAVEPFNRLGNSTSTGEDGDEILSLGETISMFSDATSISGTSERCSGHLYDSLYDGGAKSDDDTTAEDGLSDGGETDLEEQVEQQRKFRTRGRPLHYSSLSTQPDPKSLQHKPTVTINLFTHHANNSSNGPSQQSKFLPRIRRRSFSNDPFAFAKALVPICGSSAQDRISRPGSAAFLILDNAERLLSLTAKQITTRSSLHPSERNNFLVQLLLMPKLVELNLTVILITSHVALTCTRINSTSSSNLSVGSIQGAFHPVNIHFHAYRGKVVYRTILMQAEIKSYVTGSSDFFSFAKGNICCKAVRKKALTFDDKVYGAMINTVVQALDGTTRSIATMAKFARCLWPKYIEPIFFEYSDAAVGETTRTLLKTIVLDYCDEVSDCAGSSCADCRKHSTRKGANGFKIMLEALDIRVRGIIRNMLSSWFSQGGKSRADMSNAEKRVFLWSGREIPRNSRLASKLSLPYFSKFLLLSAFLCQHNKAHHDLKLYSTEEKNGKRKRRNRGNTHNQTEEENLAFASSFVTSSHQQSKFLTLPNAFPLERLLSIFSLILSNFGCRSRLLEGKCLGNGRYDVSNVGTLRFFEIVSELREFGLLQEISQSAASSRGFFSRDAEECKFVCTLARTDAELIAQDVKFELNKFMLDD